MANSSDKTVIEAIIAKYDQLLSEYDQLRDAFVEMHRNSRRIDRGLRDARSAARLFGVDLNVPTTTPSGAALEIVRNQELEGKIEGPNPVRERMRINEKTSNTLETTERPMPRVRDVVLERLKAAGAKGTKAAPIRQFIKDRYGRDIHDKTVGMTLYRLAADKLAHREGIIWFFGPAPAGMKSPGGETPGLNEDWLK